MTMDETPFPGDADPVNPAAIQQRVGTKSTVVHRGFSAKLWPIGRLQGETGLLRITESGLFTVSFATSFPNAPAIVHTALGYLEFNILGITIRVPMPIFITSVSSSSFRVLSLANTGTVSYIAWEL